MKRSGFQPRIGWTLTNGARPRELTDRPRPGLKTRQRAVSAEQRAYWGRLANEVGCIACRVAGLPTSNHVSMHHIDGRTKPDCHWQVLPLCAGHHQAGTGNDKSLVAVHPDKTRFEQLYGTQQELRAIANAILGVEL